jgi:hypothetical protein
VTHECPHCGQEVDVNVAGREETVKVTCRRCGRPSTFEAALYRQWWDQQVRTLQWPPKRPALCTFRSLIVRRFKSEYEMLQYRNHTLPRLEARVEADIERACGRADFIRAHRYAGRRLSMIEHRRWTCAPMALSGYSDISRPA